MGIIRYLLLSFMPHLFRWSPRNVVGRPGPHLLEPLEGPAVLELGADDAEERVADDVVKALVQLCLKRDKRSQFFFVFSRYRALRLQWQRLLWHSKKLPSYSDTFLSPQLECWDIVTQYEAPPLLFCRPKTVTVSGGRPVLKSDSVLKKLVELSNGFLTERT